MKLTRFVFKLDQWKDIILKKVENKWQEFWD